MSHYSYCANCGTILFSSYCEDKNKRYCISCYAEKFGGEGSGNFGHGGLSGVHGGSGEGNGSMEQEKGYWGNGKKDYFENGKFNYDYDKVERTTDLIDDSAEQIFRGGGTKEENFKLFFDKLDEDYASRGSYEPARQNRIMTRLSGLGKEYKGWFDVPNQLTVYRGDVIGAKPGELDSYTFDKNIAQSFAGKDGVIKEFYVNKNNIPWVNAEYIGIQESEVLLEFYAVKEK